MASLSSSLPGGTTGSMVHSTQSAKPKKKVGNIDKVIKPSRVALRVTVERLKENNASAEKAAWTIWGLLSSWNPNWAYNQEHLMSLKETEEGDVVESLTGLLKRKDTDVKLRALGALAQLPYLNLSIKATMVQNTTLMDKLVFFIDRDSGMDYNDLQLQVRGARVLSSIFSTPFLSSAVLESTVSHPTLLHALVKVGSTGKVAAKHEVIRIAYNLSYGTPRVVKALEHVGMVEEVLLPVLDGVETGSDVALRTLWAVVGIANITGDNSERQILKPEEILAVVTAFRVAVQENSWEDLDPAIQGTFGSVDISEAHDSALRIYPITAIVPLLRMSECKKKRSRLAKLELGQLLVEFIRKFMRRRAEEIKAAQRKEETRLKLEAIKADAAAAQPKIAGQHVRKDATGAKTQSGPEVPWEQLGLPELGSEEDALQVFTVTQTLTLISQMAAHPKALQEMSSAGVTREIALLLSDRHAAVRRRACEVLHVLAVLMTSSSEEGAYGDDEVLMSLAACLRDPEEEVWSAAALALGALHRQGHQAVQRSVLKCLHSKAAGVRRAGVGALGVMGARGAAGPELVGAVVGKVAERQSGALRVSAACALLEMAQGDGVDEVVAELARRLTAYADRQEDEAAGKVSGGAGANASDSQFGSRGSLVDEDAGEASLEEPRDEEEEEGAEAAGAQQGERRLSVESEEWGREGPVDVEGARLAVFVLGQVAPVQSREALRALRRLLGSVELTPSADESKLPPRSMAHSSRLSQLRVRHETEIPLCTFQAVVNIAYVPDAAQVHEKTVRKIRQLAGDEADIVRESACDALRELVLGSDKETVAALVELNYDPNERVVASAMRAIAQIVTGKQCEDGVLGSFHSITRVTKGSRRVLSAGRMLQPLPQRVVVSKAMLDSHRDQSHAFVYWSQAFRTGQLSVIDRAVEAKLATDRAGLPGWIYTLEILMTDLAEKDVSEREELKVQLGAKQGEEMQALHQRLLLGKDKTLAEKRVQLEKEMKRLEANRPWFSHDDADFEAEDQGFFGSKPTEEEMMQLKQKAEKEFTGRVAAVEAFEYEVTQLEDQHREILKTMSREIEDQMHRTEAEAELKNEEEMDKELALLVGQQLRRKEQARAGHYDELVSKVMLKRASESQVFVACLSKEYLQDPVCRRETLEAFHSGKRMVPVIVGTMPGMNKAPGKGVSLAGGGIWWPLRDEMGACFGAMQPVELFQTAGPITTESAAFRNLFHRISGHSNAEMGILQDKMDKEWTEKHSDASLRQRLQQSTRLKSRTEWMLVGKNG